MSNEQALLWENLELVASTTINGVLCGIALSLYFLSARSLYPQLKDPHQRRPYTIFMFVYASVVMICGIIFLASSTWGAQSAYISHNTFPGGAQEYFQSTYQFKQPGGIIESASGITVDILTVGVQIWRLWVIYSATRYAIAVVALPLLLFLCFIVMEIINILPTLGGQFFIMATIVTSQLAIDLFVTALVVIRLLVVRRRHVELMGVSDISKQYMGIAAMLIESYALEFVWIVATLVAYFLKNWPVFTFLAYCSGLVEVVAFFLVIYRVSTGRGWNKQTLRQTSSIHFQAGYSTHDTTLEA
ncbi:hypothetical protein P691DRAFT_760459 [Macrolepiota fuliginosa MF-IS2]|uniref:Uncharacterized protein n=1 Tax=Macrolepiota fuliginosa MF-IS2 TaxID=1400762 RepID=A0A9P5XAF1_9AGAR|nr:hypothetical protein P691DRAFT_760459 [Macrolepiota fuliginosa MF-IS2]